MPQYLAPGVYVEEIPGPRTIQAVGTTTTGFVGPCRYGPISGRPQLLTSYLEFGRIFGDAVDLEFDGLGPSMNFMALGVKGFFDEGGSSLYVSRTFSYRDSGDLADDHASAAADDSTVTIRARFPGAAGRMRVTFTLRVGNNVLVEQDGTKVLTRVREFDSVWVKPTAGSEGVSVVRRDPVTGLLGLEGDVDDDLDDCDSVWPVTVVVEVQRPTVNGQGLATFGPPTLVGEFGFDPRAVGTGISTVLTANPPTRSQGLTVPIALEDVDDLAGPEDDLPGQIATALLSTTVLQTASDSTTALEDRQLVVTLQGGSDGAAPGQGEYEGDPINFVDYQSDPTALPFNGLLAFEAVDDISIVAAPGAASGWVGAGGVPDDAAAAAFAINGAVTSHCERMRYRVAALDTPARLQPGEALDFRNLRSSTHAALYYPWVTVSHPVDDRRVDVPPSAYMTGIWARNDVSRGVIKAPANEVVRSALDFEMRLNKPQQELLNPQGVNCLRFFPGSGFLVWGARTVSDDPEWKYLSIRRYFNYLEKSVDEGTQWVVFEINGPALWDAVRHTVEGFLLNEWRSGALLGAKPEQGFFVRCDASTMTADDLDQGRLICLIGVAAARPAEFVIFRISQMTATTSA
jgi:phage tail sheath protein FI